MNGFSQKSFGLTTPNSGIAFSLLKKVSGLTTKMDGAVAVFGKQFSNGHGVEDASKMYNSSDNLTIKEGA